MDRAGSARLNLTTASELSAVLRVDLSETNATTGRKSVRIVSKNRYDSGLFIFDIIHTPYGCGTWPALWLVDPAHWPEHGEIDVVEAVNTAITGNQVTLHTARGCTMNVKRKQAGTGLEKDCFNATRNNAGCGVEGPPDTYGEPLNVKGGGVSVAGGLSYWVVWTLRCHLRRSTLWSGVMMASAFGSSHARRYRRMSPGESPQIRQLGGWRLQISLALLAR